MFDVIVRQMDGGAHFPVDVDSLPSEATFMQQQTFEERLRETAEVDRLRVNHPGETDDRLDSIYKLASEHLKQLRVTTTCTVAYEGLIMNVGP